MRYLKTHPGPFQATLEGRKWFEFRREDEARFQIDELIVLEEFDPAYAYTGRYMTVVVTYVLRGEYDVPEGYVVFGTRRVDVPDM